MLLVLVGLACCYADLVLGCDYVCGARVAVFILVVVL